MKKVLFVALVWAFMSLAAQAQTTSILVGGNIAITSIKTAGTPYDIKFNMFNFSPTVGYQINENWTAGLTAGIVSSKSTNFGSTGKYSTFDMGPFIRYAKNISSIFSIYGQLQSTFGTNNNENTKSSLANVTAFPAIFINVKHGFGLNFTVGGISYNSTKPSGGNATKSLNLTFGQSVGFGISKNFETGKKK